MALAHLITSLSRPAAEAQPEAPLWTFDAGSAIHSSPALAPDGTIYFGASGMLCAITNSGSNKWTFITQGTRDSSPAVSSDGTIYYASMTPGSPGSGYLYAVNPSGTEKWRYLSQGWSTTIIPFHWRQLFLSSGLS